MTNQNMTMQQPDEKEGIEALLTGNQPLPPEQPLEQLPEQPTEPQPQFVNFQQAELPNQSNPLHQAAELQKESIQEQAEVESQMAESATAAYMAGEQRLEEQTREAEQRQNEQRENLDRISKQYESQQQAVRDMAVKGTDWWSSKTTGQKVMAGIGLFLSSLSPRAMDNTLKIIDREIERDLQLQKTQVDKAQQDLGATSSLYALHRQAFNDDRIASEATKASQYDLLKMKLQRMEMAARSPMAKAKIGQLMGQIDERIGSAQAKAAADALKGTEYVNAGGFTGRVTDKGEAREFRKAVVDIESAGRAIGRLKDLTGNFGRSITPATRAAAETNLRALVGALRIPFTGGGPLTENEAKMIENAIGNPKALFSLDKSILIKLNELEDHFNSRLASQARTLGLRPQSSEFASFKEGAQAK